MFLVRVKGFCRYGPDTDRLTALNYDLINLSVNSQVQVLMDSSRAVDVTMSRVASASGITVDPLQPMLSTMASDQILKIVRGRDALRLSCAQEIVFDRIRVVAE